MSVAAKRRAISGFTLAAVAACAVLLAFALHRLVAAEKDLSSAFGEDLLWAISQAHYEAHRLALESEAWNRSGRTPEDAERLLLQLDLVFSRLAVLSEGSLGGRLARIAGSELGETTSSHLRALESELREAIAARASIAPSSLDNLLVDASKFRSTGNEVMTAERHSLASQRDRYGRVLLEAIVAVVLIVGFGIFIVVRLVASLRSAALAEDALRRDRDFSRLLLEASGDGVLAIDAELRCTHWNTALGKMFPVLGGSEVVGRLLPEAYRLSEDHLIMSMMRKTLAGESLHMPAHPIPADHRYVEKFTYPIVSGDKVVGAILFIRDVTEAHLAQVELVKHRDELESIVAERTKDLEGSLKRETALRELYKGFVSMVSHQFRTPLSIVDASAQRMIRRGKSMDEDELRERAGKIRGAVLRLTRLVSSTLNAAKVDAGQIDVDVRRCDLGKLIVEASERQKETVPDREFRLDLDRLTDWVSCDPLLIDQVIANLLSNAVKYSPPPSPIEVSAEMDRHWVRIRVCDRGVGIPDDERSRLFERFFRASTAAGVEGTGIGLHVARTIARMHGGNVEAFPREGGGSCFVLSLPRELAVAA